MYKQVEESSYMYRQLKKLFPEETVFYEYYYDGSYLDRASTTYYDSSKKELYCKMHDWYG